MHALLSLTLVLGMLMFAMSCSRRANHLIAQSTKDTTVVTGGTPPIVRPTPGVLTERQDPSAGRNLSKYDFGGRLGCTTPFVRDSPRCESSLRKARNFILSHWRHRTRGYIIVKLASVDAASNAHIFIEPDSNADWHIVWRWEGIYAASVPNFVAG